MKANMSPLPPISSIDRIDNQTTINFNVPQSLPQFEGHFPENPIVPGVTQIAWARKLVETQFDIQISEYQLSRFKFIKPILPLDKIEITLTRKNTRFSIKISSNDEPAASGSLLLPDNEQSD